MRKWKESCPQWVPTASLYPLHPLLHCTPTPWIAPKLPNRDLRTLFQIILPVIYGPDPLAQICQISKSLLSYILIALTQNWSWQSHRDQEAMNLITFSEIQKYMHGKTNIDTANIWKPYFRDQDESQTTKMRHDKRSGREVVENLCYTCYFSFKRKAVMSELFWVAVYLLVSKNFAIAEAGYAWIRIDVSST